MKINIVGDFRAQNPNEVFFSPNLSAQLARADFNIVNFEAPIECCAQQQHKSGPALAQPKGSARLLKSHGFNVFLLGNNHAMDYGQDGLRATIDAFSDAITVGGGAACEAFAMKVLTTEEVKIGVLSLVQHEFGVIDYYDEGIGVAWIGSRYVEDIIRKAHEEVDYLFVFPHAGLESVDAPLPCWRDQYKRFIDYGADGVFGSHPHAPQGWEEYNGKYIFYSLGNFYFDGLGYDAPHWCNSLMVTLDIDVDKIGYVVNVQPIVFNNSGNVAFDLSSETQNHIKYINNLLLDYEKYNRYISRICKDAYNDYRYGILRSICGTSLKVGFRYFARLMVLMLLNKSNEYFLLNVLRCETHRFVLERALLDELKYLNIND